MTDRELLELAAKAAGYKIYPVSLDDGLPIICFIVKNKYGGYSRWSPLTDDGDALRLAVRLDITVGQYKNFSFAYHEGDEESEEHGDDKQAATRRAIVRAAAEIGRNMQ